MHLQSSTDLRNKANCFFRFFAPAKRVLIQSNPLIPNHARLFCTAGQYLVFPSWFFLFDLPFFDQTRFAVECQVRLSNNCDFRLLLLTIKTRFSAVDLNTLDQISKPLISFFSMISGHTAFIVFACLVDTSF